MATDSTNDRFDSQIDYEKRMSNVWNNDMVSEFSIYNIYDTEHYEEEYPYDDGFSLYIETPEMTVLFDTPYYDRIYVDREISTFTNMKILGVEPDQIDVVVLSHTHGSISVRQFLEKTTDVVVYGLRDIDIASSVSGKGGTYIVNHKFRKLADGIYITSPIEGIAETGGKQEQVFEQALVLVTEEGLVVFVGCCHPGVDVMLKAIDDYFEGLDICMLYGGLHTNGYSEDVLKQYVADLSTYEPEVIVLSRCTGDLFMELLENEAGMEVLDTRAGSVMSFDGTEFNTAVGSDRDKGLYNWETVEYKRNVIGRSQLMDIYTPIDGGSQMPVLLYVHGGGYVEDRRIVLRYEGMRWLVKPLTQSGYAVIGIDYRQLDEEEKKPIPIIDVKDAVRWIYKHADEYGFDTGNIGIMGRSVGGYIAMTVGYSDDGTYIGDEMLKAYSSEVSYVVNYSGPVDLETFFDDEYIGISDYYYYWASLFESLTGYDFTDKNYDEIRVRLPQHNPITYISSDTIPTLMVIGDEDELVPAEQLDILVECFEKNGIIDRVTYMKIPEGKHGFFDKFRMLDEKRKQEIIERTLNFIYDNTF